MLKPYTRGGGKEAKKLPIDCVVLAIPDSISVGDVFVQLGVPHVVVFDLTAEFDGNSEKESQLMAFRFDYIYTFCIEFYKNIVNAETIFDAFEFSKTYVSDSYVFNEIVKFSELY